MNKNTLEQELQEWRNALMNCKTKSDAVQIMAEIDRIKKQIEEAN